MQSKNIKSYLIQPCYRDKIHPSQKLRKSISGKSDKVVRTVSMAEGSYITAEGLEKLQKELIHLKTTSRDELALKLRAAIQMGDLSENADYIQAKEEQGFLEGRILELESLLSNVQVIEEKNRQDGKVNIGSVVTVQEATYPEETYYLVGSKEADPNNGRISYQSPIGKSLLNHKLGDEVTIETPGGMLKLKITKIELSKNRRHST